MQGRSRTPRVVVECSVDIGFYKVLKSKKKLTENTVQYFKYKCFKSF